MKKLVIFFVLTCVAVFAVFADEDGEVYKFLYESAITNTAQLDVLENMAQARPSGMGDFYAGALRQLLSGYRNISSNNELYAASEQARILATLLGAEKYTSAAPDMWLAYETFVEYPVVRADIIVALGRMQATDFLSRIIRILRNLNESFPGVANRDAGEKLAFGAIVALEKYGDPEGYLPVYMVTIPGSWYSDRIRAQASKSLPIIAADPTPFIIEVIRGGDQDYASKLAALEAIDQVSQVNNEDKVKVAVEAYAEAWKLYAHNDNQKAILASMRKQAIGMITRYKSGDEAIYPMLERSYMYGYDVIEKRAAVRALSAQGTDDGASLLSKFLMELNSKRLSDNIRQEDEDMVRIVIPALGAAKRPIGRPALIAVANSSSWNNTVKALAQRALREIGG